MSDGWGVWGPVCVPAFVLSWVVVHWSTTLRELLTGPRCTCELPKQNPSVSPFNKTPHWARNPRFAHV